MKNAYPMPKHLLNKLQLDDIEEQIAKEELKRMTQNTTIRPWFNELSNENEGEINGQ